MFRKIFTAVLLCTIFLLQNICAAAILKSGNCGDGVKWMLEDNGTLTISGRGKMTDFLIEDKSSEQYGWFYHTPWQAVTSNIQKIIVQDGVTSVGSHSFANCENLREVVLSNSVNFIGSQAFIGCANLESVTFPASAKLGDNVFKNCNKLKNLNTVDAGGKILVASKNINENEYTRWIKPVNSYLYADGANLVRVENIGGKILVEKYSQDFKLISSQNLNLNFEIWGGFFAGKNFNFIITGKNNPNESDSVEVIKISKYDKNFNLLDERKIFGANTLKPFECSAVRCAENNGTLYIHTGHQMYKSPDGLNHQASMSIVLNEGDMKVKRLDAFVTYDSMAYVSHSFNQFVLVDSNKNIVMLDHGDAYPRAGVLTKFKNSSTKIELVNFAGQHGDNATGAALGGLAETNANYVTAYTYDGFGGDSEDYFGVVKKRQLFVSFTPKNNFSKAATRTAKYSNPNANYSYGTPFVIPQNLNGGYIICNLTKFDGKYFKPTGKILYAQYDDSGAQALQTADAQLSDCQPILFNGKIVWYVTNNSAPIFYTLDEGGVTSQKL
ncbi:MAG: leucine-rich repeat domain-containing protein [Selenomonadaceae bacterium]|nr:leucine-rich repeat domain-containing protein [Selenomonadaceae bacterium]